MTNAAIGLNNYATGENSRFPELWRGCVGAWAMCLGPTGTRLHDFSGRQNWGTLTNMDAATDWVVSGGQYALDFDGSNDRVSHTTVALSGAFGISLFFNRRSVGLNSERITWGNDGSDFNYLDVFSSGNIAIADNTTVRTYTGFSVSNNLWYHLGVNRDANGNTRVFINGRESSSGSQALTQSLSLNLIGHYKLTISGYNFDGLLDDFRLYNRFLSIEEIRLLASKRGIAYERRSRRRVNIEAAAANTRRLRILTGQT